MHEALLLGSETALKAQEAGRRPLDKAVPAEGVGVFDPENPGDGEAPPEHVVFVFLVSRSGERKTLMLPVEAGGVLGEPEDVTGQHDSPFADLYAAPGRGPTGP